jgi:outer membrane protein TolC
MKSNVSISKAERLPKVFLVGAYQIQAQADNRNFGEYRWPKTSFVGLQANIPIFSGGRTHSKIRQSNIQLQRSEIELLDASEKARTEIFSLESNLREYTQRVAIHKRTIEAAELNYRIVNDRYRNGLSSRLELTDAELALTEAKLHQLQNIFNVKVAKLQLDKASGSLIY